MQYIETHPRKVRGESVHQTASEGLPQLHTGQGRSPGSRLQRLWMAFKHFWRPLQSSQGNLYDSFFVIGLDTTS